MIDSFSFDISRARSSNYLRSSIEIPRYYAWQASSSDHLVRKCAFSSADYGLKIVGRKGYVDQRFDFSRYDIISCPRGHFLVTELPSLVDKPRQVLTRRNQIVLQFEYQNSINLPRHGQLLSLHSHRCPHFELEGAQESLHRFALSVPKMAALLRKPLKLALIQLASGWYYVFK